LKNQTNRHALALLLEKHRPFVCVVTETWLESQIQIHQDYNTTLTPPNPYQGVAILTPITIPVTKILTDMWDSNVCIIRL
jgi:hypothetical protein